MISFEIPDELREALRVEAFNKAVSMSALIRELLTEALDSRHLNGVLKNEQPDS
jgi:plasmid stability protein